MCIRCLGGRRKIQVKLGEEWMEKLSPETSLRRSQMIPYLRQLFSTDFQEARPASPDEALPSTQLTGHLNLPCQVHPLGQWLSTSGSNSVMRYRVVGYFSSIPSLYPLDTRRTVPAPPLASCNNQMCL